MYKRRSSLSGQRAERSDYRLIAPLAPTHPMATSRPARAVLGLHRPLPPRGRLEARVPVPIDRRPEPKSGSIQTSRRGRSRIERDPRERDAVEQMKDKREVPFFSCLHSEQINL
jgi:hypothetical protein